MSLKSILLSILSLVVTVGLLFGTTFLFMLNPVPGIIGIVLLIVLPNILMHNARHAARGIIDKVIATFIMPAVTVIAASMVVMMIIGWIPFPFQ